MVLSLCLAHKGKTWPRTCCGGLNEELDFTGRAALLLAAKRKGIAASKEEVRELVEGNATKQTLAPLQRSEGNTVAESEHTRWQMDLAELNNNKGPEKYTLCVVNIFDRTLFMGPLPNKRPATVRKAVEKDVGARGRQAHHHFFGQGFGVHLRGGG